MAQWLRSAVDAMGGDLSPAAVVSGAPLAVRESGLPPPSLRVHGVAIVARGRSGPRAIESASRVVAEMAAMGVAPELSAAARRATAPCGRPPPARWPARRSRGAPVSGLLGLEQG